MAKKFDVSAEVAILGLSLYVLGLAFGPILAAPISETRGRKVVYLVSVPMSALFTLGAGWSQNMASLAITRFFAGFFGSPVLAVGAGTNVDLWPPIHRAIASSVFLLAPFLGPALGPALGGFAAQHKGWRWTQWLILFITVPTYLYSFGMKETYKKIILQKRAKKLGLPPPPNGLTGLAATRFLITVTLFRPIKMLFTEPIVFFFSMYTGFNFSVLFGFFDAFSHRLWRRLRLQRRLGWSQLSRDWSRMLSRYDHSNLCESHRLSSTTRQKSFGGQGWLCGAGALAICRNDEQLWPPYRPFLVCMDSKGRCSLDKSYPCDHPIRLGQSSHLHSRGFVSARFVWAPERCFGVGCQRDRQVYRGSCIPTIYRAK